MSLVTSFVARGCCLKARPCLIGGGMTTEGRWVSFRTNRVGGSVCDVFRKFSERPFASEAARHAAEPSTAAAGGGSEDCEEWVTSSSQGSGTLLQSMVAVLTPSTHGGCLDCLPLACWPPAACLLLAVCVATWCCLLLPSPASSDCCWPT